MKPTSVIGHVFTRCLPLQCRRVLKLPHQKNSAKKAAHCRSICWLISWETEMPRPMPESRRDMSKALMPPANAPKTPPKKKNTSWDCAPVQYLTHTEQTIIFWITHLYGLSATDCQPWQASEMTNCNRAPLFLGRTGRLSPSVDCRHACFESSGERLSFVVIMFPTLSTFKYRRATIVHHEWAAHKQSSCSSSQIKDGIDKTWKPANTWVSQLRLAVFVNLRPDLHPSRWSSSLPASNSCTIQSVMQ